MNKENDERQRRCPRLGGPVRFEYCRTSGENHSPCFKLVDCWWESFDIRAYIDDNFPEEICRKLYQPQPKPKINHLLELIEAARQRTKTQEK